MDSTESQCASATTHCCCSGRNTSTVTRQPKYYISFKHAIGFSFIQWPGESVQPNKQILIPHPGNATNRGILRSWWQRGFEKKGRNPPWSENINNWDATAVTHQAQTAIISAGQKLCPFLTAYTHRPAELHKHDGTHTAWKWQWRIHTLKISTHHSSTLSLSISRRISWARERKKWGDGVEEAVWERAWRSWVSADESTWAVPPESSLPPPLSQPAASPSQPLKTLPMLLSSRFSTLPSYLRLAGRLPVPAVGSGPGAGVVPQCVAFDGQVHRGLRRCRLRAPGLSVAKSGSSSSSIRLSPRVGGASWLQLACRGDWQTRHQWQRHGPPPLLRSNPGDLRPSPSSLLYLLLGMCGRTRLLFPFHI